MIYPPNQKPPIWSIDPGIVAYNCAKAGMPHPMLAMPMWAGAGNRAIDLSRYGNHGTNYGADWEVNGLAFIRGNSDYINIGNPPNLIINDDLTIFVQFSANSDYTNTQVIMACSGAGTANTAYALVFGYTNNKFELWNNQNGPNITSVTSILDNNLRSCAVTRTGSTGNWDLELYIDGLLDQTANTAQNPLGISSSEIAIGRFGTYNGLYLSGGLRQAIVYNCVLSAAQNKFLHENPYFMYQISEELYGYVEAVGGTIIPIVYHHRRRR